ncbi:plastid division protein CDP1, chloroplastic [Impatiens glandulifera]|uniref:plastid division protein CDP1, chloroplastic n=1 Tax=Impatiens glandulifera TaxID=253017 RepID=UPI001FB13378|nr:plastid division protein CDP1, chloroplastic [Impatiens glandulifera]
MSISHLVPIRFPSCLCFFCVSGNDVHRFHGLPVGSFRSRLHLSEISSCSSHTRSNRVNEFKVNSRNKYRVNKILQFLRFHACPSTVCRSRMNTTDIRILDNSCNNGDVQLRMVEIPVTCYQVIGLRDQAEKDEIVKSVMALKSADIEEGYTKDVVASRQNFLMDVRDKLLFEPEYTGNVKDKIPPKSSLQIPWSWLPAALCLLQEVGEEKLVLDIGQEKLKNPDANPFVHDLLLCMALAECAIAKSGFEKNKISQGFEALARAQCLLRSKVSLGKVTLLSQIEESLEKLAPACTLEILGLPHTPENAERRLGAIAALRELLRQGLDVEATCQVQDWPSFLSQALLKLMAVEIVNLLHWDTLAFTRKNKTIESHNQRVVIDFNCFYLAWMAHLALGFSSKQTELINKAKTICECLKASDGIDLKFEEAFCLFLLGQVDEAEAIERLQKFELDTNNSSQNSALRKDQKDLPSAKQSLETWLKDDLLASFADTRDSSPSLVSFFARENRTSGNKQQKGAINTGPSLNPRPLHRVIASDHRTIDKPLSFGSSSRHLGPAVKKLAPLSNSEATLLEGGNVQENMKASNQFQRNLVVGAKPQNWFGTTDIVGKVSFLTALGCLLFATLKISAALKLGKMGRSPKLTMGKSGLHTNSSAWNMDSSLDHYSHQASAREQTISSKLNKLLSVLKISVPRYGMKVFSSQQSCSAASLSSSMASTWKIPMSLEEAEMLVKQWQTTKAEALGPGHEIHSMCEILDGQMLAQWQALADEAKGRSCFWKFVLLKLSITRAEISLDGNQGEIAEIEAVLEEAAELVDYSQPKNPNYYSTYRIQYILRRLDDGSWRIFEGDIIAAP